jgi:hypothetical protein
MDIGYTRMEEGKILLSDLLMLHKDLAAPVFLESPHLQANSFSLPLTSNIKETISPD